MDHVLSQITGAHILLICIWILSAITAWRLKSDTPIGAAVGMTVLYGIYKCFMVMLMSGN